VLHIPGLERNLICVSKMSDAGVDTPFQKDTCKMVRGVMVLMKGVLIGTLYKLLVNFNLTASNIIVVPKIDLTSTQLDSIGLSRSKPTRQVIVKSTRPCYSMRGWDTLEKNKFELCITKVWLKTFLNVI
jgi:hypothetical protein